MEVSKNKQYQRIEGGHKELDTVCIHDVSNMDAQSSLGKSSLGKVRSSSSVEDKLVDKDDDDKKEKLLIQIKKVAKDFTHEEPTPSEWSSIKLLSRKISWEKLRLVTLAFNAKVSNDEVQKPYPYLLTVLKQKAEENR